MKRFHEVGHWASIFSGCAGFLWALLCIGVVRGETPIISLWSAEGHEGYTGFDVLDTNQNYPVIRLIKVNARLENAATNPPVEVDDLVISSVIPRDVGVAFAEFEDPLYVQWNGAMTSVIYRAAIPMTNGCSFWPDVNLVSSNAWAKPKIRVERSATPTLVPAGQSVTQDFTIAAAIPAGALSGFGMLMLQVDANEIEPSGIGLTAVTSVWSSGAFNASINPEGLPHFVATEASGLSGLYTFTATLLLTNAGGSDVHFMPGLQVVYSGEQTPWTERAPGMAWTHTHTNGMLIRASAPEPVVWWDQQEKDRFYWQMSPKWARPGDDTPSLDNIFIIGGAAVGYEGASFQEFMVEAAGANLIGVTVSRPDGQTYPLAVEGGFRCSLETMSRNPSDLSAFGSGSYTIRLYDFTNGLRQTYSIMRVGTPVTQTPQLLTPEGLTITNTRPTFSWAPITDFAVNSGMIIAKNNQFEDEDQQQAIWVGWETNAAFLSVDLFAGCGYQLAFGFTYTNANNGANYITSFTSSRYGLFNVVTNGSNLAFARGVTAVPRVFVGQGLDMSLFEYGFLPGSNFTFSVDFGDGSTTNGSSATHTYAAPGTYTQRFIALDNTGVAGTGLTTTVVYDLPRILGIWPTNGSSIAMGFQTIDGAFYRVAESDDLMDWGDTLTTLTGDGDTHTVEDISGVTRRFYRLEVDLNP